MDLTVFFNLALLVEAACFVIVVALLVGLHFRHKKEEREYEAVRRKRAQDDAVVVETAKVLVSAYVAHLANGGEPFPNETLNEEGETNVQDWQFPFWDD